MKLMHGKNLDLCANFSFLVIDVGGTSSKVYIYNQDGKLIQTDKFASIHLNNVDKEEAIKILKDIVLKYDDIACICIGYAGYGLSSKMKCDIEFICDQAFIQIPYILVNDIDLAFKTAFGNDKGILVSSGTGSIAFSNLYYNYERRGGYGYLLGDEGSGYWIGKEIIRLYLHKKELGCFDKLYNKLDSEFTKLFNCDIVSAVYCGKDARSVISKVALLSKLSDEYVEIREILVLTGKKLAELVNDFDVEETNVCVNGSVFENEVVKDSFINHLNLKYKYIDKKYNDGYGGYLIIREGINNELYNKNKKCI